MKGEGKKNPGIIPLAIYDIFDYIAKVDILNGVTLIKTPNRQFLLRVSYLEIYNEIINDLLAPENVNLKVHEDKKVRLQYLSEN